MSESIMAWHFTDGRKLRDFTPLRAGKVYRVDGKITPCVRGLHASVRLIDALKYAPGSMLSRVEMRGEVIHHGDPPDKLVGRERKVLWTLDADRLLHEFACWCAENALRRERKAGRAVDPRSVAAIRAKREWLAGRITGEQLAAAWSAAQSAARSSTARSSTARTAAWNAAWAAEKSAAQPASQSAKWCAAWSAAMRGDAWARFDRKLTQMVMVAHRRMEDN